MLVVSNVLKDWRFNAITFSRTHTSFCLTFLIIVLYTVSYSQCCAYMYYTCCNKLSRLHNIIYARNIYNENVTLIFKFGTKYLTFSL